MKTNAAGELGFLSRVDHKIRFHRQAGFFFLLWGWFALVAWMWSWAAVGDLGQLPGADRDDVFYDNIAFNLSRGKGFQLDFLDSEWRKIYQDHNESGQHNWLLAIQAKGPTTSRAPMFPWMLSGCYRILGRHWTIPRIVNLLILSLGLACIVFVVGRELDRPWVAIISAITLSGDFGIMMFGAKLMTESLAVFSTAAAFGALVIAMRRQTTMSWVLAGAVFGFAILVRPNLNAWMLMLIVLGALVIALGKHWIRDRRALARAGCCYLFGIVLIASPWWVRNCYVANHFEPFGTAGKIGWVGGYCDQVVRNRGNWDLKAVQVQQLKSAKENDYSEMSLAEKEHWIGKSSFDAGLEWMKSNRWSIPKLMLMKATSHLGLTSDHPFPVWLANVLLIISAAVGICLSWRTFGGWATLVLGLSIMTTALTWAHHGRYSIPVRPLIHLGSAITGSYLISWFWVRWIGKKPFADDLDADSPALPDRNMNGTRLNQ